MARHRVVALLAATMLGVNIHAGPCKPYSSAALSSIITVESTTAASSTIVADVTDTTDTVETTITATTATTDAADTTEVLETTVTESAIDTTGTSETIVVTTSAATTDLPETTSTEAVVEESTATLEPTTTAAAEPVCVPTQILVNTGFDDNNDGSPWTLDTGSSISQSGSQSQPNYIETTLIPGRASTSFSQDLAPLGSFTYYLQYSYRLRTALPPGDVSCKITPSVNSQTLASSQAVTDRGPLQFTKGYVYFVPDTQDSPATLSLSVMCQGSSPLVVIGIDDVTLTRTCDFSD